MPKVFSWRGCRFHFFSNEGSPLEPCHIHVQKDGKRAKFWLDPAISLDYNYGFSGKELRNFHDIIKQNEDLIRDSWYEHFNY
jgi:hypothetical protein